MLARKKIKKFRDSDADGLTDKLEKKIGTNPKKADSDNDGVGDYQEAKIYGTDPLKPDSDNDGMPDGAEIKRGRNPKGPGLLKDLFIPHQGNNYQPLALHPKRIIFYSLSALILKAILLITIIFLPLEALLVPDVFVEQGKKIIALTNQIRTNLRLPVLRESPILDQAAVDKAQDMLLNQYFSHNGPDNKTLASWLKLVKYDYQVAGENLAMGFASPEEVVNGWSKSKTHYQNMVDRDFTEIGVGVAAGIYKNYDTTLVAQYFGTPVAKVVYSDYQINAQTDSVQTSEFKIGRPQAISPTKDILGSKLSKNLTRPALILPLSDKPINNKQLEIKVFAPGSQIVILFDQSQKLATTTAATDGMANFKLNLADGDHDLQFQSVNDGIQSEISQFYKLNIDTIAPIADQEKSKLTLIESAGQNIKIVRAEVYLTPDAVKATASFNDYVIELKPDPSEKNKWLGQTIIFNRSDEQIFKPLVMASLSAQDAAGNESLTDVKWENAKPAAAAALSQYLFIKTHQMPYLRPLFDVTSIYYKIILALAMVALCLNIFIEIKKQHPRIILYGLGLIGLLAALIII